MIINDDDKLKLFVIVRNDLSLKESIVNNKHSLCLLMYVDWNTPWMACRLYRNIKYKNETFYHNIFSRRHLSSLFYSSPSLDCSVCVCVYVKSFYSVMCQRQSITIWRFNIYLLSHFLHIALFCIPWIPGTSSEGSSSFVVFFLVCCWINESFNVEQWKSFDNTSEDVVLRF